MRAWMRVNERTLTDLSANANHSTRFCLISAIAIALRCLKFFAWNGLHITLKESTAKYFDWALVNGHHPHTPFTSSAKPQIRRLNSQAEMQVRMRMAVMYGRHSALYSDTWMRTHRRLDKGGRVNKPDDINKTGFELPKHLNYSLPKRFTCHLKDLTYQ